jgi:hypothetical protein
MAVFSIHRHCAYLIAVKFAMSIKRLQRARINRP